MAVLRFSAAGDVLLTLPAVAALRRAWPHCRIVFVTHARYAELIESSADVDQIITLSSGESVFALAARMRRQGVEAICDLHGSWRSFTLRCLLWPKKSSVLRKHRIYDAAAEHIAHAPYRPQSPLAARYLAAVQKLVAAPVLEVPLHFVPLDDQLSAAKSMLERLGACPTRPLVALVPGAAWQSKRWPVQHFVTLANMLLKARVQVVVVCGPGEDHLASAICAGAKDCKRLSVNISWGLMAAVFSLCHAAVTGDTGPMHLARAVGTPCVILFGSTSHAQFDLTGHKVIASTEHCSPCSRHGLPACPRGHHRCMVGLAPEQVFAALSLTS